MQDLDPTTAAAIASLLDRAPTEHDLDWNDGTVWFISWMDDAAGFLAERWYDPDAADDADDWRDCPGPEEGLFASLETLEVAMGERLPEDLRAQLEYEARCNPLHESERGAWGRAFALEVHHLLPDGNIVTTWAPPWADDPFDRSWDPED